VLGYDACLFSLMLGYDAQVQVVTQELGKYVPTLVQNGVGYSE